MIIMDRTRRLRMNATLRDMVRENHVRVDELIYPVFVTEENDVIQEVPSMPGICQYSLDHVLEEIGRAVEVGIKGILLFGDKKIKRYTVTDDLDVIDDLILPSANGILIFNR